MWSRVPGGLPGYVQPACFMSRQRTKLWDVLFIPISLVSLRDWWATGGIPQCPLPPQLLWLPVHRNDLYRAGLFAKCDCNFLLTLNCHFSLDKLCAQILLKTPVVQFHRWYFQIVGIPWIQKDNHHKTTYNAPQATVLNVKNKKPPWNKWFRASFLFVFAGSII